MGVTSRHQRVIRERRDHRTEDGREHAPRIEPVDVARIDRVKEHSSSDCSDDSNRELG